MDLWCCLLEVAIVVYKCVTSLYCSTARRWSQQGSWQEVKGDQSQWW